jgi:hypothetical protein
MAAKKPQVGVDIQFGHDRPFAMRPAITVDINDAVNHQHIIGRQFSSVCTEQVAGAAKFELFPRVRTFYVMGLAHLDASFLSAAQWRKVVILR